MRHLPRLITTLTTLGIMCMASPVAADADNNTGIWAIASTSNTIPHDDAATRWRYGFDTQIRLFNRGNGSLQYVLRPSLGYTLKNGVSLWAGFGYFLTDPDGGSNRYERRWWQQAAWPTRQFERFSLSLRTRLEERIFENANETGLRLRQQFQAAAPLKNGLSLIVSVEPFFNLRDTDAGARSGFDQNRSYVGLRLPLSNDASLDAGYMHQYINRNAADDAVNHLGVVHVRLKF